MAEEEGAAGAHGEPTDDSAQRTFTQDEVNKIVERRLSKERAKYEGFDQLKADSEELARMRDRDKTEAERASAKLAKVTAERDALRAEKSAAEWKRAASEEFGVPQEVIEGTTEEGIRAHAERLAPYFRKDPAPVVKSDGRTPSGVPLSTADQFARALEDVI